MQCIYQERYTYFAVYWIFYCLSAVIFGLSLLFPSLFSFTLETLTDLGISLAQGIVYVEFFATIGYYLIYQRVLSFESVFILDRGRRSKHKTQTNFSRTLDKIKREKKILRDMPRGIYEKKDDS